MSGAGDRKTPQGAADEPFLERWSRRKTLAREGLEDDEPDPAAAGQELEPEPQPAPDPSGPPALPELPDLQSLGEDSDYSAFMAPGVDESLRRKALRQLFSAPKFNVRDGLDDYCDDFTQWAPLGDIVTADMRHHLERAAKLAEQLAESTGSGQAEGPAAAAAAPAAPAEADGAAEQARPADDAEREA